MTDLNTLMTLMSALKGGAPSDAPSGGMSALLPVLLSVMNARGGTDGGMSALLPLLMNMAGGAGKPPQNAEASGKGAASDREKLCGGCADECKKRAALPRGPCVQKSTSYS